MVSESAALLRSRWRSASLAAGWRFPNDWALPEVDTVCVAVDAEGGAHTPRVEGAVGELAGARARAGIGLSETFTDVAALHAVLEHGDSVGGLVIPDVDATPPRLIRLAALGWSETAIGKLADGELTDSLTGLPTLPYFRARLAELYRAANAAPDGKRSPTHSLVMTRMDFSGAAGWCRLTGMVVAADALRATFPHGESLASVGPSTVAAIVSQDAGLASRALTLRRALTERLAADRQLAVLDTPDIRVLGLPNSYDAACALLERTANA